ncbi:MAG TPA: hypothetical protein VNZ64_01320 [Candidatus Acidoferrum sp.]|jgi:hypothetical protein|nr:hypothetical protein [Candidatus Acidoferrum sp.]
MERSFELLRWRLLLNRLDRIESSELHALVIREAKSASEIACDSAVPWLVFPCLFEERVDTALQLEAQVATVYWGQLNGLDRRAARREGMPGAFSPRAE